jgi:aerobic carbon-monoxide dehydrogenase large subunit
MDYHLPTSLDVPHIETGHGETLSPLNPMGVKGAGEAGAIPVGPLFAQALENALYEQDIEILEIPLNSNRLWELLNERQFNNRQDISGDEKSPLQA